MYYHKLEDKKPFLDNKYMSLDTMLLNWQADQNNNEIILDLILWFH